MRVVVVDHPLVAHTLTLLRRDDTAMAEFRQLADELVSLLAYEATRGLRVRDVAITTPVAPTVGAELELPAPLVVPVLRAGLGLLNGLLRVLPSAEVGFLGVARDESTLEPHVYSDRMPRHLDGRQVLVVDPMLATGGTLVVAVELLLQRGAREVTVICLVAAPEGLAHVEQELGDAPVTIVTAAVDERLNERGYIVPGLGDAGDRLYGPPA